MPRQALVCLSILSHVCMTVRAGVGLCRSSFSPSLPGLGWEAQNPHVTQVTLCLQGEWLSRAVDAGNTRLLWPGLDSGLCLHSLLSVLKLPSFWLFDNCCLDFVSVSSLNSLLITLLPTLEVFNTTTRLTDPKHSLLISPPLWVPGTLGWVICLTRETPIKQIYIHFYANVNSFDFILLWSWWLIWCSKTFSLVYKKYCDTVFWSVFFKLFFTS